MQALAGRFRGKDRIKEKSRPYKSAAAAALSSSTLRQKAQEIDDAHER
jgi:hypothetical protein